ncbi:hypothetical protein QTG56_24955 (plasmid) [Rossellomorea sp. AcN35-11]|nr:hypothetical protein [Rossellomorea aquimaris]WJV31884.1 hypothetical protein QTG56_24955 [Rossellomorea sp. AcN35-11]
MNKGIVVEKRKNHIIVLSKDIGYVKAKKVECNIGQEIQYQLYKSFVIPKSYSSAIAMVAAFILVFNFIISPQESEAVGYVSVDLNPSLELELNGDGKVIKIHTFNKEAEIVLSDLNNWENKKFEKVFDWILEVAKEKGYLEGNREILITTAWEEEDKDGDGIDKIELEINKSTSNAEKLLNVAVTSVNIPKMARQDAVKEGVSAGKYILTQKSANKKKIITIKDVKERSVSDIIREIGELDSYLGSEISDKEYTALKESHRKRIERALVYEEPKPSSEPESKIAKKEKPKENGKPEPAIKQKEQTTPPKTQPLKKESDVKQEPKPKQKPLADKVKEVEIKKPVNVKEELKDIDLIEVKPVENSNKEEQVEEEAPPIKEEEKPFTKEEPIKEDKQEAVDENASKPEEEQPSENVLVINLFGHEVRIDLDANIFEQLRYEIIHILDDIDFERIIEEIEDVKNGWLLSTFDVQFTDEQTDNKSPEVDVTEPLLENVEGLPKKIEKKEELQNTEDPNEEQSQSDSLIEINITF